MSDPALMYDFGKEGAILARKNTANIHIFSLIATIW